MCVRWAPLYFIGLGLLAMASAAMAGTPDFVGFSAVPQLWSWPDRFVIAPDGRWLASMSDDRRTIQIIDNVSGTILRTFGIAVDQDPDDRRTPLTDLAIASDSTTVIARFDDGSTHAWNAGTGATLARVPASITFTKQPPTPDRAYKIAVTKDEEGAETISISSGSSTLDPIRFRVPDPFSCGSGGVANVTFDGKELVFSRSPGNSLPDDARMPAIAFRLAQGTFHERWRAPCEEKVFAVDWLTANQPLLAIRGDIGAVPATVWNLATNKVVAHITNTNGLIAASSDGKTIVTSTCEASTDDERTVSVLHREKNTSFRCPQKEFTHLFVSPNGKWLAATTGPSTSVWSLPTGVPTTERQGDAVGVSDEGTLLHSKKTADQYHGHDVVDQSDDGRWLVVDNGLVFDTRSGRIVAEHVGIVNLTNDGHAVAKALDGTMRSFDLETGRLLWTLQATVNTLGYVIMFPNGCVKVSSGAEKFVRLVHGFASRPFDDAARSTFAKPTCKGVPAAIAASEASFQAERAHVASLARADVDEQARKRRQAEAEAAQSEAARQAWIAGAPARVAEARRAATMVSDVTITRDAPDRPAVEFEGKAAWHLSKSAVDADAVAVVTVPDLGFKAILAIDKAKATAPEGTGVVGIHFDLGPMPQEVGMLRVTAIAHSNGEVSKLPTHQSLHRNGPSDLSMLSRLDPPSGDLRLASLQPSTRIDIPLVLNDGGTATLSIAIGAAGREVIDEVLAFKKAHP